MMHERLREFFQANRWARRTVLAVTFPFVAVLQVGEFTVEGFIEGCRDVRYWFDEIRRDLWN